MYLNVINPDQLIIENFKALELNNILVILFEDLSASVLDRYFRYNKSNNLSKRTNKERIRGGWFFPG